MLRIFGIKVKYCCLALAPFFVPPAVTAATISELWQQALQAHLRQAFDQSNQYLGNYLGQVTDQDKTQTAQFFMAENCHQAGQEKKAQELYQILSDHAPRGPLQLSARYRLAELAFNRGDYLSALDGFNSLAGDSQADFLFPQVPVAQVKTNLKLKRGENASRVFSGLLEKYPRSLLDPEIKFLYAIMKEYQGRPGDALKIYAELGDNPLAGIFSGAILESQGRFLPAIEAYNQVLAKAVLPSHRELAEYYKIRAFYKAGDFLSAGKLCARFLADHAGTPCRPQAALLSLLISFSQARFSMVLEKNIAHAADWAALKPPDQSLLHYALAETWINLDHPREALDQCNQALAQAGDRTDRVLLDMAYGYLLTQNGEQAFRRMAEYFTAARQPLPFAYLVAIRADLATDREQAAFEAVRTLALAKSELAEVGLYFLAVYFSDRKEIPKLLERWALLEPSLPAAGAQTDYREVAGWARLLVADAYFRQGQFLSAQTYYQKAQALYPYDQVKIQAQAGLIWCGFKLKEYGALEESVGKLFALPEVSKEVKREISLLQAHAYFNQHQWGQAINAYRAWLAGSETPDNKPGVWLQLGWAYYYNTDFMNAVEAWENLVKNYPQASESREALFWLADVYFQAGENESARSIYQNLLAAGPAAVWAKRYELRIAQTFYNEQKDDEAIRRFMELMQKYPGSPEAQEAAKGIESASYRLTDRMNSIPAFQAFIQKFPESTLAEDIQYRISEAYFSKGQSQESLDGFSHFIVTYTKSPRTPNCQYYVAVCQEQLGNTREAMQQAAAFVKNYPQHELAPEMTFRLASDEFQLEDYAAAALHFSACADQYALKEYQPRAWFNAAVAYEKLQQPEQAIVQYQKLVEKYPQDPNTEAALSRLIVLYAAGQNQPGLDQALLRLEAGKNQALLQKTWLGLAVQYREQNRKTEEEKMLRKVMEGGVPATQEYSMALVELAALYEGEKNWADALGVYQRLVKVTLEAKWRQAAKKRIELLERILKASRGKNEQVN